MNFLSINKSIQKKTLKKLVAYFENVEKEVIRMMGNQQIFKQIVEISLSNQKIKQTNSFWVFFKESYVSLMVSAVCRQVDLDQRSYSLINLLNKLLEADTTVLITKKWYIEKHHKENEVIPNFSKELAKDYFENNFGKAEFINPTIIRKDLKKLVKKTRKIKKLRNKRIAHYDSNDNLVFDVTFDDLDEAVETIREITSKYYSLLKISGNDLIPIDQSDWQNMFTVPWINKSS